LTAGVRLGPYEIVANLGAGGMGEVYRAHDVRLGRDVAVKVLPEHLAGDPHALERFVREAQAVAALTHPNILAVFDVGSDRDIAYTVTELLEGESLSARVARGPIPWRDAVDLVMSVAEGLTAAHAKGLIHRDLKPDNVFLTSDHRVKLLDFGVARWKGPFGGGDQEMTHESYTDAGMLVGTLAYMSPEQARGEAAEAMSDIFSLGCVLHEMVTGKRVFQRATPAETLTAILREQPAPASAFDPLIPRDFDVVVARCLEKNAHDRFQDMTLLIAALKGLREGSSERVKALTPGALERMDSIVVLPFDVASNLQELEYLSDGITESLINSLSQLEDMRVVARSTAFQYRGRQSEVEEIASALKVRLVLMGRVAQRGELINVQCELFDVRKRSQVWGDQFTRKPSDVFVVQEQIASEITKKLKLKLSHEQRKRLTRRYTENTEAYQLYLRGRFYWNKRTPESMRKGIEYFQLALEKDPSYALAYAGLADCFVVLGSYSALPPKEAFPRTKMAALKALEFDKSLAEARTSLAYVNTFFEWNFAEAERNFKRAIKSSPSYPTAHQWYSFMLSALERHEEALAAVRRGLALDPLSLAINAQLVWALFIARRYDAAIDQARKALEIDDTFGLTHYWLATCYMQTHRFDEAIAGFEMTRKVVPGSVPALSGIGHTHGLAGRRDAAEQVIAEIAEIRKTRYVAPFATAFVYLGMREFDRTLDYLEQCVEDRSWWLAWLKADPVFDPIRDHERFKALQNVVLPD
jgi:serine/threonine-protein kinase